MQSNGFLILKVLEAPKLVKEKSSLQLFEVMYEYIVPPCYQLYKHVLSVFHNILEYNGYKISISFVHCFGRQKMSVSFVHCLGDRRQDRLLYTLFGIQEMIVSCVHCLGYRRLSSPAYTVWDTGDDRLLHTLFGRQEMIVSCVHCLGYRR